jgi:hypothetical protein
VIRWTTPVSRKHFHTPQRASQGRRNTKGDRVLYTSSGDSKIIRTVKHFNYLMFVPCIIRRSGNNQQYALFYILAPTCFVSSLTSSGSCWIRLELLENTDRFGAGVSECRSVGVSECRSIGVSECRSVVVPSVVLPSCPEPTTLRTQAT